MQHSWKPRARLMVYVIVLMLSVAVALITQIASSLSANIYSDSLAQWIQCGVMNSLGVDNQICGEGPAIRPSVGEFSLFAGMQSTPALGLFILLANTENMLFWVRFFKFTFCREWSELRALLKKKKFQRNFKMISTGSSPVNSSLTSSSTTGSPVTPTRGNSPALM